MKIVLATCQAHPDLTPGDALVRAQLERRGAVVTVVPWDGITLAAAASSVVCLRSTWDYHRRWPEFQRWISGFADRPGTLWNPPATVLWNADKIYLRDLAAAGVPLPLTRWFEAGERPDCDAILYEWGVQRGVLKPRISASAFSTHLVSRGRYLNDVDWAPLETAGSLLQAFVSEIETHGEISLAFINGVFSHAVRKRPARGDFRVQTDLKTWEPTAPLPELRQLGEAVLATVSHAWLYARVDIIETHRGPILMELELIEPHLFLTDAAAVRLADALVARAAGVGISTNG